MAAKSETKNKQLPGVHFLTKEEARESFDRTARYYLGMSGDEFIAAWDAGEFKDKVDGPNHVNIMAVAMLIERGR